MSRLKKFVLYALSAAMLSVTAVAEPAAAAVDPGSVRSVAADRPIAMPDDVRAALETVFLHEGRLRHISTTSAGASGTAGGPTATAPHRWRTCSSGFSSSKTALDGRGLGLQGRPAGGGAGNRRRPRGLLAARSHGTSGAAWSTSTSLGLFDTTDVLINTTRGLLCVALDSANGRPTDADRRAGRPRPSDCAQSRAAARAATASSAARRPTAG